jgi:hypothetical protein
MEDAYKVLGGERDRKRPLERHKCRWEDSIKINVKRNTV